MGQKLFRNIKTNQFKTVPMASTPMCGISS